MNQKETEQFVEWAGAIKRSDRQAFDQLFRSMYAPLVRFAHTYTKDRSSASDIVQDGFVALWKNRQSIDPGQSFKAYLYRIVRNRALNFLRDTKAEQPEADLIIEDPSIETEIEEGRQVEELSQKFSEWIDQLPERRQEAFELSRFEGLNHQEIATVMDVSPKTVNNHIVAALRTLRAEYEKHLDNSSTN